MNMTIMNDIKLMFRNNNHLIRNEIDFNNILRNIINLYVEIEFNNNNMIEEFLNYQPLIQNYNGDVKVLIIEIIMNMFSGYTFNDYLNENINNENNNNENNNNENNIYIN